MPLYEYECDACGGRFEVIQKSFSSPPPEACEKCGKGPVHRLQSSPAIQFKGSGFYITDYAKKNAPESGFASKGKSEGKSDGGKSDGAGEGKTTEAKSDTKTESAAPKDSSSKSDAPAASTPAASTPSTAKKD
jgi:putative FmdB family regulatory protein